MDVLVEAAAEAAAHRLDMPIDLTATIAAAAAAAAVASSILLLAWLLRFRAPSRSRTAPPGPGGWLPLIGHMHRLGRRPYATLTAWRRLYGDVYQIYMGRHLAVVVSGPEAIRQVCASPAAAGRPHRLLSSWRAHRRYCAFAHGPRALRLRQAAARTVAAATSDRSLLEAAALDQCELLVDRLLLGRPLRSAASNCGGDNVGHQQDARRSVFDVVHTVCFGKPSGERAVSADPSMTVAAPGDMVASNRKRRSQKPPQQAEPRQHVGSTERLLAAIERMLRFASAASVGDFVPLSLRVAPSFRRHYDEFAAAQRALVSLVKDEERAHGEEYSEHYVRDVCDLLRRAADRDRCSQRQRPLSRPRAPLPQPRWSSPRSDVDGAPAAVEGKRVEHDGNRTEISQSLINKSLDKQIVQISTSLSPATAVVDSDARRCAGNRLEDENCAAAASKCGLSEEEAEEKKMGDEEEEGEEVKEEMRNDAQHVEEDGDELTEDEQNSSDGGGDCTGSYVEQTGMLLVAGYDTVATALNWSLLLLAAYPAAQEELAERVASVIAGGSARVGAASAAGSRAVCLADRDQLACVDAFVCEVLRYASISPLAMPHVALADISVRRDVADSTAATTSTRRRLPSEAPSSTSMPISAGASVSNFGASSRHAAPAGATAESAATVVVPAGALILCNLWSVSRDADLWDRPDEFRPWRFMESADSGGGALSVEATRKLMAFGTGCRKCIGEQFARAELFLFVANVVRRCRVTTAAPLPDDLFASPLSLHVQPPAVQLVFENRQA